MVDCPAMCSIHAGMCVTVCCEQIVLHVCVCVCLMQGALAATGGPSCQLSVPLEHYPGTERQTRAEQHLHVQMIMSSLFKEYAAPR